jgi:hypothetical protein
MSDEGFVPTHHASLVTHHWSEAMAAESVQSLETVGALAQRRVWDMSPALCRRLVVLAVVGYVLLFTVFSGLKYVWFGQGHDLVLHEQAIWNTVHGRVFEISGFVHPSRLFGFDPYLIELLVVPLYALIPSVYLLFALQSLALGLGAPAVWRIARDEGLPAVAALAATLLYLAYPTGSTPTSTPSASAPSGSAFSSGRCGPFAGAAGGTSSSSWCC